MITIKELIEAGYKIQLRREQVVEYADILDVENLDIKDLMNGNYEYDVVDFDYGDSSKSIWIEKDGIGKAIEFEHFEFALSNSDSVNEFEKKLTELKPLYVRMSI